jgi:thymidylate kinase
MTLYMDLPIEEGLARTFDAAGDKHEREWTDFFERLAEGYRHIAQRERFKDKRHIIDARWTQDEVFERVVALVDNS